MSVSGLVGNSGSVQASASVADTLAELAGALPDMEKVFAFFGSGESVIDESSISSLASAAQALAELQSSLSGLQGLIGFFADFGSDYGAFTDGIVHFGEGIKVYGEAIKNVNSATASKSKDAARIISALTGNLPDVGQLEPWLDNSTELVAFGESLSQFGDDLSNFYEKVERIDFSRISELASEIVSLSDMDFDSAADLGGALRNVAEFTAALTGENQQIAAAARKMLETASDAIQNNRALLTDAMRDAVTDISGVITQNGTESSQSFETLMSDFSTTIRENKSGVSDAMQAVMDELVKVVKQKSSELSAQAASMTTGMGDAIRANGYSVKSAMEEIITAAINSAGGYYDRYYTAGSDLGQRFVDGMKSKTSEATITGVKTGDTVENLDAVSESADNTAKSLNTASESARNFDPGIYGRRIAVSVKTNGGIVAGAFDSAADSLVNFGDKAKDVVSTVTDLANGSSSIADIVTDRLNAAGADTSNLNLDWLNFDSAASSAENALNAETSAVEQLTESYQNASEAEQEFYQTASKVPEALPSPESVPAMVKTFGSYLSDEYLYLMEHIGEGLAIGFQNGIVSAEEAITASVDEAVSVAGTGMEAYETWLNERKYYNKVSLKQELAGWEKLRAQYVEGSEERIKIDREVYRVQNELVDATYQYSLDWIEKEKYYNRLSTEDELAAYERMQARYVEGSKERMELDKKVYSLRNQLVDESYENSMNWIEREKYYNRMTLSDELAAYKRVQSRYAQGTAERAKMDREVYRVEKEIYEAQQQYIADVKALQEETTQKRIELEEQYKDKVKSINEQLSRDIESENNRYLDALESRTDALYNSYGLFDEVKEKEEVDSDTLMHNLEDQVKEFGVWQDTLDGLSARGVNDELISELQKMGPSSIAQVKALASMTNTELDKYVALWQVKHGQARAQAVSELEGLRIETLDNIEQLRANAAIELDEYRETWQRNLQQVNDNAESQLTKLQNEFAEKVGLIKKNTEEEMREMTETAKAILEAAGWNEMGQQIVNGLIEGIESRREAFLDSITSLGTDGAETFQEVEEEHSPSRVFRRFGNYIVLGLIAGIQDYADKASQTSAQLGDTVTDGFGNAALTISDYLNGDLEAQPTIRPVMDLSEVSAGLSTIDGLFDNQRLLALAGQTSFAFSENTGDSDMTITVNNDGVVQELRSLRGEMAEMTERITRMQVVLDSGTMVGELAGPMDEALGERAAYRRRGN